MILISRERAHLTAADACSRTSDGTEPRLKMAGWRSSVKRTVFAGSKAGAMIAGGKTWTWTWVGFEMPATAMNL